MALPLLPLLAVAAPIMRGVSGLMAGNANASAAREQAGEERSAAARRVRRQKEQARTAIGEQLALMHGGGLEGGSGTALDLLRRSQVEAALDAMELRREGATRGRALDAQARNEKRQGQFALLEGFLGAGNAYLDQRHDWAQARTGDERRR